MPSDRETLLSMGFDPARVDWALRATNGKGLQPAMDHLLEHEGDTVPTSDPLATASSTSAPAEVSAGADEDEDADAAALGIGAGDVEAKSIRCSVCNKVFRNTALANYHAEKTGHDQFEESTDEIKPLTEAEKKEKLADLRAKMSAKRAVKAEQDAKDAKANEQIRRKQGKDINKIKDELKAKEIIKEAEQKRRVIDKVEDAKAKAAVRAQIEADKKVRAEKAEREKALREGRPIVDASAPASSSVPTATPASGSVAGKDFKDTRLQIRLANGGTPYVTTLPSDSTLQDVAEFVASQTLDVSVDTVSFAQHFPRKTFTRAMFGKTLRELGLTPSAVLIAS